MILNYPIDKAEIIRLTENSIMLLTCDEIDSNTLQEMQSGMKKRFGFSIPIIMLPSGSDFEVSEIDDIINKLQQLKTQLGEKND